MQDMAHASEAPAAHSLEDARLPRADSAPFEGVRLPRAGSTSLEGPLRPRTGLASFEGAPHERLLPYAGI
jgi:hypothetical protein